MKKMKRLSLFLLCLTLLLQVLALPAGAEETTQATTEPEETGQTSVQASPQTSDASFGTVCIQNGCRTIEGMVPLGGSDRMLDTAQSAFLYEVNTDTVVYSYNPDLKVAPGSLTKIVAGFVAMQYCKLDEMVTVEAGIKGRIPVSALRIDLTSDEEISVRDLMYALLLKSANDAAVALAEHISGNRQGFVLLMNQWVKQIGCTDTEFATVHGVDGGTSVTTARDMARILREVSKNEEFMEIMGTAEYTIAATNTSDERRFRTTNYMIDNGTLQQFYDTRVKGGLQSTEDSSGACLAVISDYNNLKYVGVVMGCVRTYNSEKSWVVESYGNFEEMTALLKFGYNNYKVNRIVYDGMTLNQIKVAGGESNAVGLTQVNIDSVVPANAQMRNLTVNIKTSGGGLSAPIQAGEKIGTVEIWYRNSCMAEAEVFSMGNVKAASDTGVTIHSTALKGGSGGSGILSTIGTVCVIGLGLVAAYLAFNSFMRARRRAKNRRRRAERRRTR